MKVNAYVFKNDEFSNKFLCNLLSSDRMSHLVTLLYRPHTECGDDFPIIRFDTKDLFDIITIMNDNVEDGVTVHTETSFPTYDLPSKEVIGGKEYTVTVRLDLYNNSY